MKDRSDDPSHHERTLLPRSYISDTFFPFFLQFIIYYKSNTLMPVSDYQVRSVSLTCTFRASCYSARLLRAQVSAPLSGTGKKGMEGGGGGGGGVCTSGYKGIPAVRPGSVAGGGSYGVMKFGMSRRINSQRICAHFNEGNWAQLRRSAERGKKGTP